MNRIGAPPEPKVQEIHCHECNNYVRFILDLLTDGNHVLNCPICKHEHCRVVKDGRITDVRWDSRNGPTIQVTNYVGTSSTGGFATYSGSTVASSSFLYNSWLSAGSVYVTST